MMDDLISRQDAIDEVDKHLAYILQTYSERYGTHNSEYVDGYKKAHEHIKEVLSIKVPSAQPEKVCIAKITLSEEQIREAVEKAKSEIVQVFPSAQPEITTCIDCIHYIPLGKDKAWGRCSVHSSPTENQRMCQSCDFCAWAERRTDGSD